MSIDGCFRALAVFHDRILDYDAGADVLPESNEQLARQCDDHRLFETAAVAGNALLEPESERRVGLVAQPQPGELDHRRSQTRISGFRYALLTIDIAALPRRRSQSRVGSDLAPVFEASEQTFRVEYRRELWTNSSDAQKSGRSCDGDARHSNLLAVVRRRRRLAFPASGARGSSDHRSGDRFHAQMSLMQQSGG